MNPLVSGLFKSFKQSQDITTISDDDAFELFSSSLALPDEVLSQVELSSLFLDPGTPGIDICVIEINGQVVRDEDDVEQIAEDSSRLDVSITFIQAKRSARMESSQILNMGSTVKRFLNCAEFDGYPAIDSLSRALKRTFDFAAKFRRSPMVVAYYITTAVKDSVENKVAVEKTQEISEQLLGLGFIGGFEFYRWGTDDIYAAWMKKNNANEVEVSLEKQVNLPVMPGIDQAILGVVSVAELFKMITRDGDQLDERVFYENVRGFQGVENPVNNAMLETMKGDDSALLTVLNNGVTVVAESYAPKPGDTLSLSGYQIVNGCQTTNCLYLSRENLHEKLESTFIPMKVVVTSDRDIAAQIIRATNSQTAVRESDLVALSEFQKRLEDFYRLDEAGVSLTYERRTGQFYGKDVVKTRVVTINDQLRSVSAVVLRLPHSAARYPSRLYDQVGDDVFNSDHQLLPYVASAFSSYKLENAFRNGLEARFKAARYHILMTFAFQVLGRNMMELNSPAANQDAKTIIDLLNREDPVKLFGQAASAVLAASGGDLPSRDRLKGQPFTQDLLQHLRDD